MCPVPHPCYLLLILQPLLLFLFVFLHLFPIPSLNLPLKPVSLALPELQSLAPLLTDLEIECSPDHLRLLPASPADLGGGRLLDGGVPVRGHKVRDSLILQGGVGAGL